MGLFLVKTWGFCFRLVFGLCVLSVIQHTFSGQTVPTKEIDNWNILVLDKILARVRPDQEIVAVGDMGFKVSVLRAWRDHLVAAASGSTLGAGEEPDSAFLGGVVTWTNGTIPYTFDPAVSEPHQQAFLDATGEWAMFANLHFVPLTTQTNYLLVKNAPDGSGEGGLSSGVGMMGGMQYIQIGPNSWNRDTLCHEIGHVLGLVHEHQRSDRDSYVNILTANISGGVSNGNFTLLPSSLNKGAYDFLSVMHYARNAQSINGMDTIEPKTSPIDYSQYLNLMGMQFDRVLSAGDRSGIAQVYGTNATATSPVVTNTWDCHDPNTGLTNELAPGFGSLRAAIYYGIDHPGTTITFNIPASYLSGGVFTIQPSDYMTRPASGTIIDGTTQTGGTGNPVVVLDGTLGKSVGNYMYGLRLSDANCVIKGLQFTNFSASGLYLFGGAHNNVIGGTTSAARNVISGNTERGVYVTDSGTTGNLIEGNYIGVARDGVTASANGFSGLEIAGGAQGNFIGGNLAGAGNVISGNTLDGVRLDGTNSNTNTVDGNLIGVKASGTVTSANGGAGVDIFGGAQTNTIGPGNVISGNTASGIIINASNGTIVQGNYVGLGVDGATVVPNAQAGVYITSGAQNTTVGAGNVISGNTNDGVDLNGVTNMIVQGNYIGIDATGSVAKPNGAGVALFTNASSNTIGGTSSGTRNVISGNTNDGVNINGGNGNIIEGNYIGVDVTGVNKIANGGSGVDAFGAATNDTIGGTSVGSRNFISGNAAYGIALSASGTNNNLIQGNTIGLNILGSAIANSFQGVAVFNGAQSTTIGGSTIGASNIIAGNTDEGVALFDSTTIKNTISQNSIYSNHFAGIGVYTNSNNNQAAPTLSSAILSSGVNPNGTDISGTLASAASTNFRIEFFASPSGGSEGQFFVGSTSAMTNGGGTVSFTTSLAAAIPAGEVVTATAADPMGNTSPFSSPQTVTTTDTDGDGIPDNWMLLHFGHATGQAGDKSRATDDADGDGLTNLQEFLAGTDPKNPTSHFAISSITSSGGSLQISFGTILGKTYQLQYRNDLATGNWLILADQIFGTGGTIQIADPGAAGLTKRFYRLVLEL